MQQRSSEREQEAQRVAERLRQRAASPEPSAALAPDPTLRTVNRLSRVTLWLLSFELAVYVVMGLLCAAGVGFVVWLLIF